MRNRIFAVLLLSIAVIILVIYGVRNTPDESVGDETVSCRDVRLEQDGHSTIYFTYDEECINSTFGTCETGWQAIIWDQNGCAEASDPSTFQVTIDHSYRGSYYRTGLRCGDEYQVWPSDGPTCATSFNVDGRDLLPSGHVERGAGGMLPTFPTSVVEPPPEEPMEVGDPCFVGRGACTVHGEVILMPEVGGDVRICSAMPPPQPTEEICGNGIDEDCDGAVDDNCTTSSVDAPDIQPMYAPGSICHPADRGDRITCLGSDGINVCATQLCDPASGIAGPCEVQDCAASVL